MLEYKGYFGSIDPSPEDGCLYGKLEFITALVNYEAETVPALNAAFREAVDDYLADCARLGREPEIPCKGSFNVRVGHDTHLRAAVAARECGLSLNDFTRQAIELLVSRTRQVTRDSKTRKPARAKMAAAKTAAKKSAAVAPRKRRA